MWCGLITHNPYASTKRQRRPNQIIVKMDDTSRKAQIKRAKEIVWDNYKRTRDDDCLKEFIELCSELATLEAIEP